MKPVKIAMMSLTHGHTRKYYQTLRENSKLDWVASCAEDQTAKDVYDLYDNGVPCYLSTEEMFEGSSLSSRADSLSTKPA